MHERGVKQDCIVYIHSTVASWYVVVMIMWLAFHTVNPEERRHGRCVVATISLLWWHSKGKDRGWELQGSLSHGRHIGFWPTIWSKFVMTHLQHPLVLTLFFFRPPLFWLFVLPIVHRNQWRSQDEQVTWAQHGHIQCVHNTHLLGELGHAPTTKFFWIYILSSLLKPFLATNTIFSVLHLCSLHVHMKVIAHANNWLGHCLIWWRKA